MSGLLPRDSPQNPSGGTSGGSGNVAGVFQCGSLIVQSNALIAGDLDVGGALTSTTVAANSVATTSVSASSVASDEIDAKSAGALTIGASVATSIVLADTGVQTELKGSLQVDEASSLQAVTATSLTAPSLNAASGDVSIGISGGSGNVVLSRGGQTVTSKGTLLSDLIDGETAAITLGTTQGVGEMSVSGATTELNGSLWVYENFIANDTAEKKGTVTTSNLTFNTGTTNTSLTSGSVTVPLMVGAFAEVAFSRFAGFAGNNAPDTNWSSAGTGTLQSSSAAGIWNYLSWTTQADGHAAIYTIPNNLAVGVYRVNYRLYISNSTGIVDFAYNPNGAGYTIIRNQIDCYQQTLDNGDSSMAFEDYFTITAAQAGPCLLRWIVNGKNASSSNYAMQLLDVMRVVKVG